MNAYAYAANLLRKLYHTAMAALAVSLASNFLLPGLARWIGLGLNVYIIYLMIQLKQENDRYRKAAIFYGIALGGNLLGVGLFSLIGSICALVAQYQEYHGHSELVSDWDPKLSGRWSGLFWFQLAATLILSLLTGIVSGILIVFSGMDETTMTVIATLVVAAISLILQGVYLVFLKRTIKVLESDVAVV